MGNPALRRIMKKSDGGAYGVESEAATYKGVYLKAGLYGFLTIAAAMIVELILFKVLYTGDAEQIAGAFATVGIALAVSIVPMLIIALVIAFVPSTVKVLGCVYALLQGAMLGITALFVDLVYPGIAFAAFLGTMFVFVISLVVNGVFKVRISSKFIRGMIVTFVSIALVQLVMWVLSLFGIFDYRTYNIIMLAASALCIIWATAMLFIDLNNIDYIVATGADKKYEWIVAFSLVTTLIYLYMEILEILVRIASLFSKNN